MKKVIHHFSRGSIKALEIFLGLAIVLMIVVGFSLWKMSREPFDLMFAEKYIARSLSTDEYDVSFKDVDLKWPQMKGPLRLDIKGVELRTPAGDVALSVDQVDIGISSVYLTLGMIRPVSLYLDNPTFRVVQADDGSVTFLFQGEQKLDEEEGRPISEQIRTAIDTFANPAEDNFLRRFRMLVIQNARVVLQDKESGEEVELTELNARFRRTRGDVNVNADMFLNDKFNNGVSGIGLSLHFDRQTRDLTADAVFKNLGPAMLAKILTENDTIQKQSGAVNGKFSIAMDADQRITDFSGAMQSESAEIYWPQEYDEPIRIGQFDLLLGFDQATQTIQSERFTFTLQDTPVEADVALQSGDDEYQALMNIKVPEIPQETLEALFPKSELDGELAKWLVHQMDNGVFRNVTARIPLGLKKQADETGAQRWAVLFSESNMHVTFDAEDVDLVYQDTLMPAEDIKGSGVFDGSKLEVKGESGRIRDVNASNVRVVVSDIAVKGGGYADISLDAKGPLSTVLRYIADEPIAMADDIPFKADEVKGTVDAHIVVGLPTVTDVPKEEVKVKITGTLADLLLPKVVEGLNLTEGPLTLETMDGGFSLKGDAKLDGAPVTLDMVQYFNSTGRDFLTKVNAKVNSNADLRSKFGVDLSDYISGDLPLDVDYVDTGKGRETVAVKGDLAPTQVHIRPFRYEKASGVPGSLSLDAVLEDGRLTGVNNLNVDTKDLAFDKASLTFRPLKAGGVELSGGKLPTARIGQSVANVDFSISTADVLTIKATSPVFDARPFLEGSGRRKQQGPAEKTQPMIIDLKADKVVAQHDQQITGMKLYTEMDTDSDITRLELTGRVGEGDASVLFRPDPETGNRFFRLETTDGGALLAAIGLYENIRGGSLSVFGEPKQGESSTGNIHGTAQLENFRVVRAPALAKLFGLMSLGGLGDLLGQQGIAFSKLEADFEWQFRPEGNLLLISNGRTSGSSVGLTFEGMLDRGADTTDIKGTIIPMTEINNVLKNIPLLGEILTGGSGLIAATYTMRGPSEDPSVMVNPLSVLAPGFLRKLLFEGGFEKPRPQAQSKAPPAKTPPVKTSNIN